MVTVVDANKIKYDIVRHMGAKKDSHHNPAKKKELIFKTALVLFSTRKFHGTTILMIAEKSKVAAGTIYRFFESKEVLFNALFFFWKSQFLSAVFDDFPKTVSPREQFHTLFSRVAGFALKYPNEFLFLEEVHHEDYMDKRSLAVLHQVTQQIVQWTALMQQQNIIKPIDPIALLSIVYGAFTTLFKEGRAGKLKLTPEIIEETEQCCWEGIIVKKIY